MLLVAVDIEGCAGQVVDVAGQLAVDLGCPMTLLYAAKVPSGVREGVVLPGRHESAHDLVQHEAAAALRALAAPWVDRGVTVEVDVRFGTAETVVLEAVTRLGPRFLVLGTHGRVGVSRWVFGSVEESITRRSPVPVLVVSAQGTTDHLTPVHRALLAEESG